MATVVLDGLDSRTSNDIVQNFCQGFGRILNCYIKLNQCTVTFGDHRQAEDFVRSSPHRLDAYSCVHAKWKMVLNPSSSSSISNSTDSFRLIIRGTKTQLEEKALVAYFSQFGNVRMCQASSTDDFATITFDDARTCQRVLQQSRHFLQGRSLIVEPYTVDNKRRKCSETTADTTSSSEKNQLLHDQQQLQVQLQERTQLHEYEKQQWQIFNLKQQNDYQQQIVHYQILLKQSVDEMLNKDRQIAQLTQENKDIDELLRQSVHDNEQQQIHLRKREDVHNQTKRKYEDLYKAYMKLKDGSPREKGKEPIGTKNSTSGTASSIVVTPKLTIDDVRKKL